MGAGLAGFGAGQGAGAPQPGGMGMGATGMSGGHGGMPAAGKENRKPYPNEYKTQPQPDEACMFRHTVPNKFSAVKNPDITHETFQVRIPVSLQDDDFEDIDEKFGIFPPNK